MNRKALYKCTGLRNSSNSLLFHPDYTVGVGISPTRLQMQVADFTASGESHPALKNYSLRIHFFPEKARGSKNSIF